MINFKNRFIKILANFDKTYKRYLYNKIDFNEKLIGIIGAKGVGKTTILLQYLKESPIELSKKLYVNAEFLQYSFLKLFDLAEEFEKRGGKILVIDEIHKYKDFEKELKLIYDTFNLQVIFSGSSAIKLEHSKADLSRRAVVYRMNNLSFREFLELKTNHIFKKYTLKEILQSHEDIAFEILTKIKPFEYFEEYLQKGAYPFYFDNPHTYCTKLEEAINASIDSDLSLIFDIKPINLIKLKKLIYLICNSEPFELNITKLSQKIEISRNYLYQYIYYLGKGDIFTILNSKTRGDMIFVKPQKIYLKNTNLNYCYCENSKKGTLRETFFANQLFEHKITHTDKGDFLIDDKFVIEVGGKNKSFKQIKNIDNSFVVADDIEVGFGDKIPLWLFGFLY